MMGWIVFGIIVFVVTLWVWRHTYTDRERVYSDGKTGRRSIFDNTPYHFEYDDADRLPLPRWILWLLLLGYLTPIVNIIVFIIWLIAFPIACSANEWHFHFKGNKFTKAMAEFFTKDVYAKKKSE